MSSFLFDVRFALRMLVRSPASSVTILVLLIAGIGATTAVFSVVDTTILKSLPYPRSDELYAVSRIISRPDFVDWKEKATSFAQLGAVEPKEFSLADDGSLPEFVLGSAVSANFFDVFAVQPERGRFFGP